MGSRSWSGGALQLAAAACPEAAAAQPRGSVGVAETPGRGSSEGLYARPVTSMSIVARRAAVLGATFAGLAAGSVIIPAAANADTPVGWSPTPDPHVTPIEWLLVLLICPVGIALIISLAVLLPGILRGEGLLPKPFPKSEREDTSLHH